MDFIFAPQAAVNIATGNIINQAGVEGSVHASEAEAVALTNPLTVVVAGGVSTTNIPVSSFGQVVEFTATDHFEVWWNDGSGNIAHLVSFKSIVTAVETNAAAAAASNTAAQGALAAAEALDASRMKLAGAAVAQGAAFWGVWQQGFAPTPPNDGQVHWGLEIVP